MSKVNAILDKRLGEGKATQKMAALATQSAEGRLTSFSGIFGSGKLGAEDQHLLKELLVRYSDSEGADEEDLRDLIVITSEVRAINNQAAMLHGERIQRAQSLLKRYRDGAFTAWLIAAYGNRQTPYNFLQYYEFYQAVPRQLHAQVEALPRQAVYTLASRQGDLDDKIAIIKSCQGQTKDEILAAIRDSFPLTAGDRRHEDVSKKTLAILAKVHQTLSRRRTTISAKQKTALLAALGELSQLVAKLPTR